MLKHTHSTRIGRRTRGMVGVLAVAGALMVSVPSAQASGPAPAEPGRYQFASQGASASSMVQRSDGYYSGTLLHVFRNDQGTHVCIEHTQYDAADTLIAEYGCAAVPEQGFTLDKKLHSATLAPTLITLNAGDGTSRTVAVAASMQGVGELERIKDRFSNDIEGCTYDTRTHTERRTAATTVTLDEQIISGEGSLSDGTNTTVVRCD